VLLTVEAAARLMSCGTTLVKEMLRRGELRAVKLGRLTRIPRSHLEAVIDDLFVASREPSLTLPPEPPSARRKGMRRRSGRGATVEG
jgi:excisionase family DNA binding protein